MEGTRKKERKKERHINCNTVELHWYRVNGTASQPDMQKIRITEFFYENRLHWQFEVGKNFYKRILQATCLFTYK